MARAKQGESSNHVTLDDIDRDLVAALQHDGRQSYSRIAADLGIAESVARYRVQRMEKAGILQIVGIADPLKVGFDLMALIGVNVQPGTLAHVSAAMAQFSETSYVAATAGRFDIIVEVVCRDTAHFSHLLTEQIQIVPGVSRTESFLVLSIEKMAYGWDVRKNVGGAPPPVTT